MNCERCGQKFNSLKRYGFSRSALCMKCLYQIVDEYKKHKEEFHEITDNPKDHYNGEEI